MATANTSNANKRRVPRQSITFEGPGLTKQAHKDECDINKLMSKYQQSGQLPAVNPFPAQFGDFSGVTDYHTALNQIDEAEKAFRDLPSAIRTRFENNPEELLSFIQNEENREEAEELGLVPIEAKTVPTGTPPVTDPVTPDPDPATD